jgi:hypothetical protein
VPLSTGNDTLVPGHHRVAPHGMLRYPRRLPPDRP